MLLEWLVRSQRKTQWYPFTSKKPAELPVSRQASDLPAVRADTISFLDQKVRHMEYTAPEFETYHITLK